MTSFTVISDHDLLAVFLKGVWGGARRFDGVRLGLLIEVDPDTGGSHAMGRLGLGDVRHWDHPLVRIQQVIQLHHRQKLLQLSNIHNITCWISQNYHALLK